MTDYDEDDHVYCEEQPKPNCTRRTVTITVEVCPHEMDFMYGMLLDGFDDYCCSTMGVIAGQLARAAADQDPPVCICAYVDRWGHTQECKAQ